MAEREFDIRRRIIRSEDTSSEERPPKIEVGVFSETQVLKKVAIWGLPGPETILGQLLPERISLFYERFDVVEARREYEGVLGILAGHGVKIEVMQDRLVRNLGLHDFPFAPRSFNAISDAIKNRGMQIYREFGLGNPEILDLVDEFLEDDFQRLGERKAIILNYLLSLQKQYPLANMFFGRDQTNVLGEHVVFSRMRWPIRQPEVALYRAAYKGVGKRAVVHGEGYFEGGDGIMFDGGCFIGAGGRTSPDGIAQIYEQIGPTLKEMGIECFAVINPLLTGIQESGQEMSAMHLDTYFMPVRSKIVACCLEEAEKRRVYRVTVGGGGVEFEDCGLLSDFMPSRGWKVINVPKQEQEHHGTNFLVLDHDHILASLSDNRQTISGIENEGITVKSADIRELVGGYGGVHCMTASLQRV